jgi:hypothetical protein
MRPQLRASGKPGIKRRTKKHFKERIKVMKKYRLWYRWNKSKRFDTLEQAQAVANEVARKTGIILTITLDK